MRNRFAFILLLTAAVALPAQTQSAGTIQATGNASLSVNPDQASIDVSVITQGATAQQAAQQNATQTNSVIGALKQVLGSSGTIQTVSYSVYPTYSSTPGQSNKLIGYTASNTVRATTTDLTLPGPLIDAANQAGAGSVSNLSFSLQNPEPYEEQALTAAAKQAQAHAAAIAAGLGVKAGGIVSAQEGSQAVPVVLTGIAAGGTSTPIQSGPVTVSANVTITVQLSQ